VSSLLQVEFVDRTTGSKVKLHLSEVQALRQLSPFVLCIETTSGVFYKEDTIQDFLDLMAELGYPVFKSGFKIGHTPAVLAVQEIRRRNYGN